MISSGVPAWTNLPPFSIPIWSPSLRDSSKSLKDDEEIYRVRRLSENIRRISEYASDIAEIVLNMNIEKTLKKTE